MKLKLNSKIRKTYLPIELISSYSFSSFIMTTIGWFSLRPFTSSVIWEELKIKFELLLMVASSIVDPESFSWTGSAWVSTWFPEAVPFPVPFKVVKGTSFFFKIKNLNKKNKETKRREKLLKSVNFTHQTLVKYENSKTFSIFEF